MRKLILLIAALMLVASVAYSHLGEQVWGAAGSRECAWGTDCGGAIEQVWGAAGALECAWGSANCGAATGPPPTSSCTFDTGTFGTDCTF